MEKRKNDAGRRQLARHLTTETFLGYDTHVVLCVNN